jgi:endo-1,4-beta-xylanase
MRQNLLDSIVIGPIRCRPVVCAALLASWAAGCTPRAAEGAPQAPAAPAAPAQQPEGPSLARKYDSLFPIGAAVDPTSLQTHAPLLQQHFNSVTPENEMKFESLERTEGAFDYAQADALVAFAQAHGMRVRGHTLVWHRQTPDWVFQGPGGAPASPELLLSRLKHHIDAVVTHFKGRVYAWDVVNEAIMDDGQYRTAHEAEADQRSPWHGILGVDYIAKAFEYAHAADPEAKLFYNDYRHYIPAKRQAIYAMLKELLARGVPIHGVGLQCHLNIEPSTDASDQGFYQTVPELEAAIELYASLGLDVQVTELDLSLYVPGVKYTPEMFYTAETFTDALEQRQARRYAAFFELFRKHAKVITGVTFWGIADDNTWLSEFSSGRKDFPLLFDEKHEPKPAFEQVMAF